MQIASDLTKMPFDSRVLVRLDHVAHRIVNANHGIMETAAKLSVADTRRR